MKNILVFQTASFAVMRNLFAAVLSPEHKVFCVTWDKDMAYYENLYPAIQFIFVGSESFYEKGRQVNKILSGERIDAVYIPSSTPYFYDYNEVFFLIGHINYKSRILYDCNGKQRVFQKKNAALRKLEYVVTCIWSSLYGFWYRLKYRGCRE